MEHEDNDIILSELKKFSTFQNPNCFDDYYMKVLPSLRKFFILKFFYFCS